MIERPLYYFNDSDQNVCAWVRELIKAGILPIGEVDELPIQEVQAADVRGFAQCHFFGGISGWPLALQLAGWPDDRPVWTGSCPCPPFSVAGRKRHCPECQDQEVVSHPLKTGIFACVGCAHEWYADDRHLWPEFLRLIRECRPPVVFGEQVSGADGVVWFAGVRASLEQLGYAVGCLDLAAGSVGAPQIRQRLFWVAIRQTNGAVGGVEHPASNGRLEGRAEPGGWGTAGGCGTGGLGDTEHAGSQVGDRPGEVGEGRPGPALEPSGLDGSRACFWSNFGVIPCRDGKSRRVPARCPQPGIQRVADGLPADLAAVWAACRDGYPLTAVKIPGRAALLRGYGNAIVPEVVAEFIRIVVESGACRGWES